MGTVSFPGVKNGRGVTLTPHPLLVSWSRKSRTIPPLPLWAVRPVHCLSACTRVHFTFFNFFGQQRVEMNIFSPLLWIITYIKPRRVSKYNEDYFAVSRTVHKHGLQSDNFKGLICHLWSRGPGELTRHSDSLRTERSWDRIQVEVIISAPIQTESETHPAFNTMGTGSLSRGYSSRGFALSSHPHLKEG